MWKASKEYQRNKPWNGVTIGGKSTPLFQQQFIVNEDDLVVYTYNLRDKSVTKRVVLNQTVYSHQRYNWDEHTKSRILYSYVPSDVYDIIILMAPMEIILQVSHHVAGA